MTRLASPFDWIGTLGFALMTMAMVSIVLLAGSRLRVLEQNFHPDLNRSGVVQLAAPWSTERAQVLYGPLLVAADERDRNLWIDSLRRHTLVDFIFAAAVSLLLALVCGALAQGFDATHPRLASIIGLVAWGVLLAFVFDAVENAGILWMLGGHISAPWPQLTTIASILKWMFYAGGSMAVVVGLPMWALRFVRKIFGGD